METPAVVGFVELLREILQAHARKSAESETVIAMLDERDRWMPLLRETVEVVDGVLVDATELGAGVECGPLEGFPDLVDKANDLLARYNHLHPDADLRLEISDGTAKVSGAVSYGSANRAQQAYREVVTALCADDLRSAELVVLVYAQDSLDKEVLAALWPALTSLSPTLSPSGGTTLVVVAGDGQLFYDIHCTGDPSLQFRVTEHGMHARHRQVRSIEPIRVAARFDEESMPLAVWFLGAGASIAEGLPVGDTLRNESLAFLTGRHVDRGTFTSVAADWYAHLDHVDRLHDWERRAGVNVFVETLTLERVIQQEQYDERTTFSTTLRKFAERHEAAIAKIVSAMGAPDWSDALRDIVCKQRRLVLATVNFDRVIETRCGDLVRPFITDDDMQAFPEYLARYRREGGQVPLLKLHGDIGVPESLVANLEETTAGLSQHRSVALRSLLDQLETASFRPWWYVGYSMRDRDLDWRDSRLPEFDEHWVAPFLDPSVASFIKVNRLKRWRDTSPDSEIDRLISLTAEEFYAIYRDLVATAW